MNTVCISVKALYDEIGDNLTYGKIEVSEDGKYFDLYNNDNSLVACMDGEEVIVIHTNDNYMELLNSNGEIDMNFKLSKEEFEVATFILA
jgi:hypothetical protein